MSPTRRTVLRRASSASLLGLLAGCTDGGLGGSGYGPGAPTDTPTATESPTTQPPTSTAADETTSEDTADQMGDGTTTGDGGSSTEPTTVTLEGFAFAPVRATVDPGATVRWINEDGAGHDVTSAQFHDGATAWEFSRSLASGESVSHTFESPGVYEYYCTIHGRSSMCGVVLVGDASLSKDLPCESGDGGYGNGDDGYGG